ncbi:MAG: hypothetical protein Tsb0034_20870 [Ekhidna sp.]
MIYNGKEVEFPAVMQVSFFKLIEKLEEQSGQGDERATYAKELLKEVEKFPELRNGISDVSKLKNYKESIDKLSRVLFPEVLTTNEIKILTPPFYFEPIYASARFKNIVEASGEPFSFTMKDVDEDLFYMYCCFFIMASYYGYPIMGATPQMLEIANKQQGFSRVYKMLINADMSEFTPTDKAVDITQSDYEELVNNFGDIKLWKEKFPPNSWIMKGLNIVNLVDVTTDQSINTITSNLLVKSPDAFEKISWSLKRMLNNVDLAVGVISMQDGMLTPMDHSEVESILLKEGEFLNCEDDLCEHSLDFLFNKKEPFVVTDAELFYQLSDSGLSKKILKNGFMSYIIAPVVHEGELLGFLELGAKKKFDLHRGVLAMLDQVLPILAMAKKRFQTEAQNLVEAIIQQECTTIHTSVKWRFEEEAKKFMIRQLAGESPEFSDIVFDQLYPLYGQLDIKGSSERRNEAVCSDLIKQLSGVRKILEKAHEKMPMPAYEELLFRLGLFQSELEKELKAGSEHRIMTFLDEDVYPVFRFLHRKEASVRKLIDSYYKMLDADTRTVYEERRKYDSSVNRIINTWLGIWIKSR